MVQWSEAHNWLAMHMPQVSTLLHAERPAINTAVATSERIRRTPLNYGVAHKIVIYWADEWNHETWETWLATMTSILTAQLETVNSMLGQVEAELLRERVRRQQEARRLERELRQRLAAQERERPQPATEARYREQVRVAREVMASVPPEEWPTGEWASIPQQDGLVMQWRLDSESCPCDNCMLARHALMLGRSLRAAREAAGVGVRAGEVQF